jgi:DNA ligase-1
MKRFAQLYRELDETTKTNRKVASLVDYFRDITANTDDSDHTNQIDAAWAIWFLCGQRPRRIVAVGKLREWCAELAGIPDWLFAEAYDFVGDLAETIALLLPVGQQKSHRPLSEWVEDVVLPMARLSESEKKSVIVTAWQELDARQRFVFNKLLELSGVDRPLNLNFSHLS